MFIKICWDNTKFSGFRFVVKELDGKPVEEYIRSNEFQDNFLDGVVFTSEIKAVSHEKYIVYLSAFSGIIPEEVAVHKVCLFTDDGSEILNIDDIEKKIVFDGRKADQYYGFVELGEFSPNDFSLYSKMHLTLNVQVEVNTGIQNSIEELTFNITVMGYKRLVTPT